MLAYEPTVKFMHIRRLTELSLHHTNVKCDTFILRAARDLYTIHNALHVGTAAYFRLYDIGRSQQQRVDEAHLEQELPGSGVWRTALGPG